ncbi:MAG: hypothetical protein H5T62_15865 [Anaerolineae bacterium]|nr:hypothetical protein [Anaerolineae bacterium]
MSRRSLREQINSDEPLEVLTRRPSKAKRNREWERRQREERGLVAYRGIPRELQEELKQIAQDLGVTVGEIARVFLEYALEKCKSGELVLGVKPVASKYTLYIAGDSEEN